MHDEGHGKHPLPLPDLSCFPPRFIRVYCSNALNQASCDVQRSLPSSSVRSWEFGALADCRGILTDRSRASAQWFRRAMRVLAAIPVKGTINLPSTIKILEAERIPQCCRCLPTYLSRASRQAVTYSVWTAAWTADWPCSADGEGRNFPIQSREMSMSSRPLAHLLELESRR